jgi:menaquinone-dependent protoporphyrinogen oxidase
MSAPILVAYATIYGSTQEVAESMAASLRGCGFTVDVQPAKQVRSVAGYRAVVLGAPLYMFRWHADAKKFLSRHHATLASLPLSIFALGPFHNKEEELKSAREMLDKELVKFTWLKPASVEVFVGKFDPKALRFPYNLIPAMKNMPPCDERNWPDIQAWTAGIAERIKA